MSRLPSGWETTLFPPIVNAFSVRYGEPMSALDFKKEQSSGKARAGTLLTPHGIIRTPAFAPVGTKANVKGILPEQLGSLGADVVLANTYHLYLQPGEKIVKEAGGVGKFMGWKGPTMTY